ncbi:MAG: hypothetical protein ACPL7K_03680, partial [Armatimonadota bacterium]
MDFVLWVFAVALAYLAIWLTTFLCLDSLLRRNARGLFFVAAGYAAAYLVTRLCCARIESDGRVTSAPVVVLIIVFCWTLDVCLALAKRLISRGLTWQDRKHQAELSRQIKLHLALVTGAVVFSVPFYWLVTTSLKPDERTNMFPPDIIPMMQRTRKVDGVVRKVYVTRLDGREVRVVKLNELAGDNWEVRFLDGTGAKRILPASRIKPDLYPAALWSNYRDALSFLPPEYRKGWVPLWNTIYVTGLVIIGTVLSSSLVAFAFARLRWPGRDLLFVIM